MDNNDSFYMILPSNVSSYSNNKISNFKTKLPKWVILNGSWEVALTEIGIPKTWYTLKKDSHIKMVFDNTTLPPPVPEESATEDVGILPAGLYESEFLIKQINKLLENKYPRFKNKNQQYSTNDMSLQYNHRDQTTSITHGNCELSGTASTFHADGSITRAPKRVKFYPLFKPELAKILGFTYTDWNSLKNQTNGILKSTTPIQLQNVRNIMVYCDIILPTFLGDTYSKVLRVIPVPQDIPFGEQINIRYEKYYYVALATNEFDTIEIHIKDEFDENVAFEFGSSVVTLHFRKKQ